MSNDFDIMRNEYNTPAIMIENVPEWLEKNKTFIEDFIEFSKKQNNAYGVAANQVSNNGKTLTDRFFVYRTTPAKDFVLIINPVIEETFGEKVEHEEGCLSWPGKTIITQRHLKLNVSYTNIKGERVEKETLNSLQSIVWQHEIDHLNGVKDIKFMKDTYERALNKVGRNDPCPCGSMDAVGKPSKYKKCCGK